MRWAVGKKRGPVPERHDNAGAVHTVGSSLSHLPPHCDPQDCTVAGAVFSAAGRKQAGRAVRGVRLDCATMSYSMDEFMAMPFDDAKRALGTGEVPAAAMLEGLRMPHGRDTNLGAHKESSWQTDSETWGGGGGHHRDVGGTEKLANWAVADPGGGFGDAGRLGQNQLLTDWSQGAERRGSNSSWSSSAPSSRSAEPQYPDSFTGKHRARHPVLTDKPAEHPEYVGDGGHSFGANHARARHGSDLQPAVPGGRTGGWRARGGGGGGGGGGARPSRAPAAPAHVIMDPVAD